MKIQNFLLLLCIAISAPACLARGGGGHHGGGGHGHGGHGGGHSHGGHGYHGRGYGHGGYWSGGRWVAPAVVGAGVGLGVGLAAGYPDYPDYPYYNNPNVVVVPEQQPVVVQQPIVQPTATETTMYPEEQAVHVQ